MAATGDSPAQVQPPAAPRGIAAWLALLRVPNLLTVPGDPAAGFLLAIAAGAAPRWDALPWACLASLLLYAAGLIQNDICDRREDRRERPNRPLASGAVSLWAATVAFAVAMGAGLAAAAQAGPGPLAVAAALVVIVLLYNSGLKRPPVIGPLSMGLCRGLSVLVGTASAVGAPPSTSGWQSLAELNLPALAGIHATSLILAAGVTLYVAALTVVSRRETRYRAAGPGIWAPAVALAAMFAALYFAVARQAPSGQEALPWTTRLLPLGLSVLFALTAVGWALRCASVLWSSPEPAVAQRVVGALVRGLIRVQTAAVLLCYPWGLFAATALMLCWYAAAAFGRRFYGS